MRPFNTFGQLLLLFLTVSCLSVQRLNSSLEQPVIDIASTGELIKPFPTITLPEGIEIDSVFYPSGLVPQSFSTRTGVLIIPLLLYNRFQSNYMTTLGAQQFEVPINDAFKERFQSLLKSCEDSGHPLKKHKFKLTMDLQSCQVQGIYVYGSWSAFYIYGTISGTIARGRNASSFVKIRWELSEGKESVVGGNVMVTLKDPHVGQVNGFLIANGQRIELTKENLVFGIPFEARMGDDPYLNSTHIDKMAQVLCLSLDKASETILKDIQHYFNDNEKLLHN